MNNNDNNHCNTDIKFKLSQLNNFYPIFEPDQILTYQQLNDAICYLDNQSRLTRVNLLGIGIVCGLEVHYDAHEGTITITPGTAVTSDGDLLFYREAMEFTKFRIFEDKNAHYDCFLTSILPLKQIYLLELLTKEQGTPQAKPISSIGNLSTMIVVLYLESYVRDLDICTGSDCDNKGKEQRNNLRALLANKNDIKKFCSAFDITTKKSVPSRSTCYFDLNLDDLIIPRVLLNPPDSIRKDDDLYVLYKKVIKKYIDKLSSRIPEINALCFPFFTDIFHGTNPTENWLKKLSELPVGRTTHIQYVFDFLYVYDFLKDLSATFFEFKEALFFEEDGPVVDGGSSSAICNPDIYLFPKHILLGPVMEKNPLYRHEFYPSPLFSPPAPHINNKTTSLNKAGFLYKRIDYLFNTFNIPYYVGQPIKITPSYCIERPLSIKSIPFYYEIAETDPINEHWNHDLFIRHKSHTIYGYYADIYNGTPQAREPLKYSISDYPFFRIEGHVGKNVEEAENVLKKIISEYNLPISVLSLQIERDVELMDVKPHYWCLVLRNICYFCPKFLEEFIKAVKEYQGSEREEKNEFPPLWPYVPLEFFSTLVIWLDEFFKTLELKVKRYFIFSYFLERHAGMEHLAGVERGGTFILIYTGFNKIVIADCALPYLCCEMLELKEFEGEFPEVLEDLKIFWNIVQEIIEYLKDLFSVRGFDYRKFLENLEKFIDEFIEKFRKKYPFYSVALLKRSREILKEILENLQKGLSPDSLDPLKLQRDSFKAFSRILNTFFMGFKSLSKETKVKETDFGLGNLTELMEDYLRMFSEGYRAYADAFYKIFPWVEREREPFRDVYLENTASFLEGLKAYAIEIDKKIGDGTATDDEKAMRKEIDAMISNIIKLALLTLAGRKEDIVRGSEEERFFELLGESLAKIKDSTIKNSLLVEIKTIKTTIARGKKNLIQKLDELIGLII